MLYQFLKTIRDGEVQSLMEIARALQISLAMTLQMAEELTQKGYLQELGADCTAPQTACSSCPTGSRCQVMTRHWFLTEKGKAAVSEIDAPR